MREIRGDSFSLAREWALLELEHTRFGSYLPSSFQKSSVFTVPTIDVSVLGPKDFESGGRFTFCDDETQLAHLIIAQVHSLQGSLCIIEDPVVYPDDPVLSSEPGSTFTFKERIFRYLQLNKGNTEQLQNLIRDCDRSYRLVGIISVAPKGFSLPMNRGSLGESIFIRITQQALLTFASAFDGEGFVCLQSSSSREPLNNPSS